MKFGESLQQRSIPQWANYNVDYDELKHLIKARTTNVKTIPLSVPGQGSEEETWKGLENELFPILCDQFERVNLFTKSKYGELARRLDYVERQLKQMAQRGSIRAQNLRPVQQTNKYSRLVRETDAIGEEIQSLSRFASVQRLAFKKILKKYQKWTGSTSLQIRMNNEVFNKPTYFLQPDFPPLLERLSEVRVGVQVLSNGSGQKRPESIRSSTDHSKASTIENKSSASQLHDVALGDSGPDFDSKFSTVPLGVSAAIARYWIHPDNIEEAKVLLLRHMKDRSKAPSSFSRAASSSSVPQLQRNGVHNDGAVLGSENDRLHVAMFDNLQRLVQEQTTAVQNPREDVEGSVPSKVALRAYWTEDAQAVAVTSDLVPSVFPKDATNRRSKIFHIQRRELPKLLSRDTDTAPSTMKLSKRDKYSPEADVQNLRDFLAEHRDVKPLAEIHSRRSRFAGINNSTEVGVWAALDQEITMTPVESMLVGLTGNDDSTDHSSFERAAGQAFPHAVLEIRWEFSRMPEVVRAFDSTHLAERIRNFSLEFHAIYTICKPKDTAQPRWQPLLMRDIRKVPPKRRKLSPRQSGSLARGSVSTTATSSGPPSSNGPSGSGFSASVGHSSATSEQGTSPTNASLSSSHANKLSAQQKKFARHKVAKGAIGKPQISTAVERYWNEFDDGELQEDQSYAIYINPDEPYSFPGVETISRAFSSMGKNSKRVLSWLSLKPRDQDDESSRRPLLGGRGSTGELEDSSDSDDAALTTVPKKKAKSRRQSSARSRHKSRGQSMSSLRLRRVRRSREKYLFRSYTGLFFLSFVLLLMSTLVATSEGRGLPLESGTGVIIGIVAAIACGLTGISLMLARKEPLPLVHFTIIYLAFCVICVGSGVLLAFVLGGI